MACEVKDCEFQMLNDDEIVTSMQEESDPVDDETDEDEDNNNESSKGPSNANAFSVTVLAKNKIVLDSALRLQSFRIPENATIGVRSGIECQQQERWRPSSRLF
ncbi:hypothetical protein TNCV_4703061 [Trichonephila clavipes]|nr:hypothetical protein TNCV_4703061 [Trichonephila clavipes]